MTEQHGEVTEQHPAFGQIQNLGADDVFSALGSNPAGLDSTEAASRIATLGRNSIEVADNMWWLRSLARQFTNFFTILLDISAAICFFAEYIQPGEGMALLGWALLGVSILNALFSFFQEYRAERAMEELRKYLPHRISVHRDGREQELDAADLVPGDVIQVREGDRIPADARVVECRDLTVSNAPLTGESNPLSLSAEPSEKALTDARNLLFAGCTVLRGSGLAVVFATGFRSQFGRIAMLSQEIRRTASPLERATGQMVRILTVIAVAMGLTFFAYGVVTDKSLWVNLVFMMGIIVANVPEGLLPTFTLSLAMGSLRMAKRNVLVKSLNAVETLGSVHVICTDKTGTLTLNRLEVVRVTAPMATDEATDDMQRGILDAAVGASDLTVTDNGYNGDPLDVAIAARIKAVGGDPADVLDCQVRHFAFDVAKRRAAGVLAKGNQARLTVKGAWESLKPLVTAIATGAPEGARPVDAKAITACEDTVSELARQGYRVIAVAANTLENAPDADAELKDIESGLTLLGFICLEDPLRAEVPDAVDKCHSAGIRTVMITGDHPETAEAIARRAGMVAADVAPGASVVTGDELEQMREEDLVERFESGTAVFARTTPEQKMKIVSALHRRNLVVAMTGDGVNDAPALKSADVGVAMGKDGTDVAREAAQVILLDDNFASIVAGIEEGRTIFANIRKFTNYVLVSNGPEIIPYLLYMLFPVPLALTVIQILSIDLGTDIVPSMALGQEKPDGQTMKEPPRSAKQGLLTLPVIAHSYLFLGLIEAAFSMSLFFWVLFDGGWTWGAELATNDPLYHSATGIALSSILLMQIGNLFGRRSRFGSGLDMDAFRNRLIVFGVTFEIVFSWAILYAPWVGRILGTGPVATEVYLTAWLGVPLIFGLDYLRKRVAWRLAGRPE
ncbi:cation-transporting P-type ATPase [Thalassospiraceae bacterium LMO-JJ14]|nr:cation-transporting P-type ATPase [Thalassospiraceae bacterium LMO-JJ14]